MPALPHLKLDLTVDMPFPSFPTPPAIDEVLQNDRSVPATSPDYYPPDYKLSGMHSRENAAAPIPIAYNRTAPLPSPGTDRSMSLRGSNTAPSYASIEERMTQTLAGPNGRTNSVAGYPQARGKEEEAPRKKPLAPRNGSVSNANVVGATNANVNHSFMTDFFSPEVFQVVLHNPTTAHRFLRFCQSRACGENMEFLHKEVEKFRRLVDEMQRTLGDIHSSYTAPDASKEIKITSAIRKEISDDVKYTAQNVLPGIETIFVDAQVHIENILAADTYRRFVKHQITTQATTALATQRERFQGLGDCFCLTDPAIADNPITFASDGFVLVTGYSRKEIVPRNCRFLQGDLTDHDAVRRLRTSIDACEETVELLLNYRKNGDPFWNLLYVAPLFNEHGEVSFFLGGQINCSTTVHSCTDVLRILSVNDDELDQIDAMRQTVRSPFPMNPQQPKPNSAFFKNHKKYNPQKSKLNVRDEVGMEQELLSRVGRMNFKTQVEAFYTAYSKYIVMSFNPATSALIIQHFSLGVIDMLCLNLPNGDITPIFNKDIFKVLSEHSSSSPNAQKTYRGVVKRELRAGKAISVEMGLLTGIEQRKGNNWFATDRETVKRVEEKYVSHWTPLKDEDGRSRWVVLTIAPKI